MLCLLWPFFSKYKMTYLYLSVLINLHLKFKDRYIMTFYQRPQYERDMCHTWSGISNFQYYDYLTREWKVCRCIRFSFSSFVKVRTAADFIFSTWVRFIIIWIKPIINFTRFFFFAVWFSRLLDICASLTLNESSFQIR